MQHKVLVAIGVVAACVAVAQAVAKVDDDAVKANVSAEEHTYPAINFGEQVSQMTCSGAYKAECRAVGDAILHVFKGLEAAIEPYTITFTAAEAKVRGCVGTQSRLHRSPVAQFDVHRWTTLPSLSGLTSRS